VKLAPSILAGDFARLGDQVTEAERGGAARIHVDVMDERFLPNLSMGATDHRIAAREYDRTSGSAPSASAIGHQERQH
jgi:pentose-5-phosphate-3-epimerase